MNTQRNEMCKIALDAFGKHVHLTLLSLTRSFMLNL